MANSCVPMRVMQITSDIIIILSIYSLVNLCPWETRRLSTLVLLVMFCSICFRFVWLCCVFACLTFSITRWRSGCVRDPLPLHPPPISPPEWLGASFQHEALFNVSLCSNGHSGKEPRCCPRSRHSESRRNEVTREHSDVVAFNWNTSSSFVF